MAKTICLAQSKGGTSKTSSVLNIAAALVGAGHRVLVVDTDQQASLTVSLGIDPLELPQTMRHLLIDEKVQARDILTQTQEGIDLIPASIDLAMIEFSMPPVARERVLATKLNPLKSEYDFILIDTPPTFSITTLNAMSASDYVLVPVQPEPLCLYGLEQLNDTVGMIKRNIQPSLSILGLFLTLFDTRSRIHKGLETQLREGWGDLVLKTVIHRRINILEASLEGKSVVKGRPGSELAHEYQQLTREVLERAR